MGSDRTRLGRTVPAAGSLAIRLMRERMDWGYLMLAVLVTIGLVASLLLGLATGWFLRPIAAWCRTCGGTMACTSCGHRPTVFDSAASNGRGAGRHTTMSD